jgi:hypothetical protein
MSGGVGRGISVAGILDAVVADGAQAMMSALAAAPIRNSPFILHWNGMIASG